MGIEHPLADINEVVFGGVPKTLDILQRDVGVAIEYARL